MVFNKWVYSTPKGSNYDFVGYSNYDFSGCRLDRNQWNLSLDWKLTSITVHEEISKCNTIHNWGWICYRKKLLWSNHRMKQQLKDYDVKLGVLLINCDNTSAINLIENPILHLVPKISTLGTTLLGIIWKKGNTYLIL